jgi:hypothetical protein
MYIPHGFGCQAFSNPFLLGGLEGIRGAGIPGRLESLCLGPTSIRHQPNAFSQGNQPIDGHMLEEFHEPIRPMHFDVDDGIISKAEVHARVVARIETALAQYALSLCFPAIMSQNPRSNSASIGLHSLKFYLYPIWLSANVIA